jgi:hypothetical protein
MPPIESAAQDAANVVHEPEAEAEPDEVAFADGEWRWRDEKRRRLEKPPTIPVVVRHAVRRHGAPAVVEVLGLSRVTVLGIAAGGAALASTMYVAGARLGDLARLDALADDRAERDARDKKNGLRRP